MSWQQDKAATDVYLNQIKSILGLHLIGEPPIEEDRERNTDLIVLKMEAVRVGCRIRNALYAKRYPQEFTIREGRPSGVKTELTKIIEGWGDYFFYGFGDGQNVVAWTLCDLTVFRVTFMRHLHQHNRMMGQVQHNRDNSSTFRAYSWDMFPDEFVVAQKAVEVNYDHSS